MAPRVNLTQASPIQVNTKNNEARWKNIKDPAITALLADGFKFLFYASTKFRTVVEEELQSDFAKAKRRLDANYGPENIRVSKAYYPDGRCIVDSMGLWVRKTKYSKPNNQS